MVIVGYNLSFGQTLLLYTKWPELQTCATPVANTIGVLVTVIFRPLPPGHAVAVSEPSMVEGPE